ncbi:hypothetical protein Slin14017_G032920 [Septoria linicola]|nr:hypothetical protein Slin14017_G032920 [Septoria linicola]
MSGTYRNHVLTALQGHKYSFLSAVMEQDSPPPPPVPPKDVHYRPGSSGMDISRPPSAPASGSKRRRDAQDDISYHYGTETRRLEVNDNDRPTPSKRSRSHAAASDGEASDTPSQQAAKLRRKKGIRNLSNLNLRHAASTAIMSRRQESPPRESRFQEGSLNDKPSQQPPSVFTRLPQSDSGNLSYVDELMADYHEGMPTPARDVQATIEYEKEMMPERVAEINARSRKEDAGGMFRFGKSWGTNFHPVALWNRLWNDTKEELTRQNILEAERKARLKAEAEAKYAQMKSAGQFGGSHIGLATPRDSAVVMEPSTEGHRRTESLESHIRYSEEEQRKAGAAVPEPPRTLRGRLSRMHLRKPSLVSLTGTVKRAKSDFNLAASQRESSASISPLKAEFDGSASILRSSASKYDLKKQNRLSKRVSNLEEKLQNARMELDRALADASPAPKLNRKFERFTPVNSMKNSLKRSRFVPGALPTLPSERVLFPELRGPETYEETVPRVESEVRTRKELDLSTAFDDIDEDTVRPSRGRSSQLHAKDIFNRTTEIDKSSSRPRNEENREPGTEQMDVEITDANNASLDGNVEPIKEPNSAILDAKLNALDDSVKAAKKPAKSKKRRPLANEDKVYNPGRTKDHDDDEWEEAAQNSGKKKRKSGGKTDGSPSTRKVTKSPQGKVSKKTVTTVKTKKKGDAGTQVIEAEVETSHIAEDVGMGDAVGSEDELARPRTAEGDDALLDPVYEEEEETSTMALQDEPPNPTATATPARYGRSGIRSRSNSPYKRTTRATSRQSRSASPPSVKGISKQQTRAVSDTVKIVPGVGGVPSLPKRGSKDENFEWPDDVF